jgi:2Fe-2S ferredoxin
MPKLVVTTRQGEERSIQAEEGMSVMETIRMAGIDEIVALCGGCCSCATCHVYADEAMLDRLPAVSEGEDALLDCVSSRAPNSRLSCQIPMIKALDGLRVTVAPES